MDKRRVNYAAVLESMPRVNGCWTWTKARNAKGYGICGRGLAHRVSYETYIGPIPDGMNVCHSCDVRECVNPNHLWLGTQADNVRDAKAKKRMKGPTDRKGEAHPMAKLTASDVENIRAPFTGGVFTPDQLGYFYGVSPNHIRRIWRGERWAA